MSKAAYWQRGETLDYVNNTGSIIEANTVIKLAERIGIAACKFVTFGCHYQVAGQTKNAPEVQA